MLDGDQAPLQKGGRSPLPNFRPMSIVAKRLDGSRCHLARRQASAQTTIYWMGTQLTPTSSPKKGYSRQFSAHVYCRQTSVRVRIPLGMEVGRSLGEIVLDGDPAPSPLIFGQCPLWPNSWMDQDDTWQGGGPWSKPHCARWSPSSPSQKRDRAPNFRPIFIVAKRLDASGCQLVWR